MILPTPCESGRRSVDGRWPKGTVSQPTCCGTNDPPARNRACERRRPNPDLGRCFASYLGAQIEITQMLGMITQWHVVGPFHNRDRSGFETIFAPEQVVDLKVSYQGKSGSVSWQSMQSDDRFGMVDLNQPYPGYLKEVTAYAYHDFYSSEERPAQLRLGCKNASEDMSNGEFVFWLR